MHEIYKDSKNSAATTVTFYDNRQLNISRPQNQPKFLNRRTFLSVTES